MNIKEVVVIRCVALALALSFLARELSEYLASTYPHYAPEINTGIGLLLVSCVGVFCLRPIFLRYADKAGENKRDDAAKDAKGSNEGDGR